MNRPTAARGWVTMHEAMEMGFTYRGLEELVRRGEVFTRRSGGTVLYDEGSLTRCLAATGVGLAAGA